MDLARLDLVRDVARLGSIAAVARRLNCDASIVSRSISSIEKELRIRLFQRTTRHLQLTEAGALYLGRIGPALDELAAAADEAAGLSERLQGRLTVTASSSFGQTILAPLICSFQLLHPDVSLELLLTDDLVDLVGENIDVAFRLGAQPVGGVVISLLKHTAMRAVASPAYLQAAPKLRTPEEIPLHRCLVSAAQSASTWLFRRVDEHSVVAVRGSVSSTNTLFIRECVTAGLGVAVLADWVVKEAVALGHLVHVLPDWEVAVGLFETAVWIVYPTRTFLPAKTRTFIDHVRDQISSI